MRRVFRNEMRIFKGGVAMKSKLRVRIAIENTTVLMYEECYPFYDYII